MGRRTNLINLKLHRNIWSDHNHFIHGSTRKEATQLERTRIVNIINDLYKTPPQLASRYYSIPLSQRQYYTPKTMD